MNFDSNESVACQPSSVPLTMRRRFQRFASVQFTLARFLVFAVGVAGFLAYTTDDNGPTLLRWLAAGCFLLPLVGLPFRPTWGNTLLAVCLAFVVYVVPTELRSSRVHIAQPRSVCRNNLQQITRALQQYQLLHGEFPPAYVADANGKPMHSWRVFLLPYLERQDLFNAYRWDEPWDGPNNKKLHEVPMRIFSCPSDDRQLYKNKTSYLALVGPQTCFPHVGTRSLNDIADGPDKTILLVEVRGSGIHWLEPRDISPAQYEALVRKASPNHFLRNHPGYGFVSYADGNVSTIPDTISPTDLWALMTIAGGEAVVPP